MITYNSRLRGCQGDLDSLRKMLEYERDAYNVASGIKFGLQGNAMALHWAFYDKMRKSRPEIPSQVLIRAENACYSAYKSIKSNKHRITKPILKKKLAMRLDKRLYSRNLKDPYSIRITTADKRKTFGFTLYEKLKGLLDRYPICDPLIYEDDGGHLCIALTFDNKVAAAQRKLALGVDLGIRVAAACSDGRIYIDRKFNAEKRRLRYLKRSLQSKGSHSARRHLRKLRHREHHKNKNQAHHLANAILKTDADTICLENLKGIKARKHRRQNKNAISQVPLYLLRTILSYKAENGGKTVLLVNPAYTSQTDCFSGLKDGVRVGRRYYSKSGAVYDADLNAARNIGHRSKLPVSYGNVLDGQAHVSVPIVQKSLSGETAVQAPEFIRG